MLIVLGLGQFERLVLQSARGMCIARACSTARACSIVYAAWAGVIIFL